MKIWCPRQFADINRKNNVVLKRLIKTRYAPESVYRIAIVGGGPKGSYAVERLASVWNAYFPAKNLDIVVFNESPYFGSGPNYQPDQPDFLLMNYPLGKVNFWTDEEEQLVSDRLSLFDFLANIQKDNLSDLQAEDYCSRSLTGVYLQYCLCRVVNALPSNIRLHLIMDKVTTIEKVGDGMKVKSNRESYGGFAEVLCCTGHSYQISKSDQVDVPANLIKRVYPVQKWKSEKVAGKTVLMKGLGLTFIDGVLALTEGKGGTFYRKKGILKYHPSGEEPELIYGFSRTGLPMICRQKEPIDIPLKYCTVEAMEELMQSKGKVDFKHSVLPLMEKEFRYRYARLYCRFVGKSFSPTFYLKELEGILADAYPSFSALDFEEYLFPARMQGKVHQQILNELEAMLFPYAESTDQQARLALSTLWKEIYPYFSKLYAFGGLTGSGQEIFDKKYRPGLQRVSYGPPKVNIEKLLALADSRILRFDVAVNPQLSFGEQEGKIIAQVSCGDLKVHADLMIDARIPTPGSMNLQPEYMQKLAERSGVSLFSNQGYQTGCPDINKNGRLLSQHKIAFYGTPTEGCTLDNESLSRDNNNLLSSWARQLIKTYAKIEPSRTDTHCTFMD